MKYHQITLLVLALSILIIPSIIAAPQQVDGFNSMELRYPQFEVLKQNQNYSFHFHLYSKETGLPYNGTYPSSKVISCSFHLYDTTGNHIMQQTKNQNNFSGWDIEFVANAQNFTENGIQSYLAQCICESCSIVAGFSNLGGFISDRLYVTPNGTKLNTSDSISYGVLISFLAFIMYFTFLNSFKSTKRFWIIMNMVVSYFNLLTISYLLWHFSANYLYQLEWIIALFYIGFIIILIMMFPFILGLILYLLSDIVEDKKIKNLLSLGYSGEEAKRYK